MDVSGRTTRPNAEEREHRKRRKCGSTQQHNACIASSMTEASEENSEQKEHNRRNTENGDDDSLDVPGRLVDEGEVVHHVKKNADNASVDLKNSRETNPARLVWSGPNPSLILFRFPNRQGSESSS